MQVEALMTEDPACCTPNTPIHKVAQAMVDRDCGAVPIVDEANGGGVIGVVTDRDLVVRVVAERKPINHVTAREVMTETPVTVTADDEVEDVREAMGAHQIRRVLVCNEDACVGIVAQADLARHLPLEQAAETLRRISQATPSSRGTTDQRSDRVGRQQR